VLCVRVLPRSPPPPQIAAAVSAQLGRLNSNSRYLNADMTDYLAELTATLPEPLQVCVVFL
jgi:4-aminobutyrate aminotransferase-like enzyme